jgi:hypothetical protein
MSSGASFEDGVQCLGGVRRTSATGDSQRTGRGAIAWHEDQKRPGGGLGDDDVRHLLGAHVGDGSEHGSHHELRVLSSGPNLGGELGGELDRGRPRPDGHGVGERGAQPESENLPHQLLALAASHTSLRVGDRAASEPHVTPGAVPHPPRKEVS